MTPREFWDSTPREFKAHMEVAEVEREIRLDIYANIQASLHNGPLVREDRKPWTREMFRVGAKPEAPAKHSEQPAWQESLRLAREAARRMTPPVPDPQHKATAEQTVNYYNERAIRARAAVERGESRDVVDRIMRGEA